MKRCVALVIVLALCLALTPLALAETPEVGAICIFGQYEQDNDLTNGMEPIEWVVLDVQGDRAFLMSLYCLDVKVYYHERVSMYWGISPLREWMNNDFVQTAFSKEEQARLVLTTVKNENPNGVKGAGDDTLDMVYFLSREEAIHYMPEMADRIAYPTEYAKAQGCFVDEKLGSCRWWLRTPGARKVDIEGVRVTGQIAEYGKQDVDWPDTTIRPVMWVDFGD